MVDDNSNDYGRTDNPTEKMMRLQKKAEETYGKITHAQLEDQQIKAIAQIKGGRAGNSINGASFLSDRVDIEDLLDDSIAKVAEDTELNKLEPYDRYYYLYVWQGLLKSEKSELKPPKNEYEAGRREVVKVRLKEIEMLLGGGDLAETKLGAENKESDGSLGNLSPKEQTFTKWMRGVWWKAGQLKGSEFFYALKHYKDQTDSPIVDWYTTSSIGAGVKRVTEDGTKKHCSKKRIQKLASQFAAEKSLKDPVKQY